MSKLTRDETLAALKKQREERLKVCEHGLSYEIHCKECQIRGYCDCRECRDTA